MTILVRTDNNIQGSEGLDQTVQNLVSKHLKHFEEILNSIEVHLRDENAGKHGARDKTCVIEARIKGMPPQAVTCQSDNVNQALQGAMDKMKSFLTSLNERQREH